ncbi:hypothetical protein RN001_003511 [Aquatica leii]|uniref:MADF domain-containing protein n=1 Tax=Aquatica leii TaxID=1421715 RepID=A0AAN7QBR6_9COLE|nr:hypothetical protein RN001_003511 [Aquatica leii]
MGAEVRKKVRTERMIDPHDLEETSAQISENNTEPSTAMFTCCAIEEAGQKELRLAREIGEVEADVSDCQGRWNALRARFSKERSKVLVSGSGGNKPEWPLYKHLQFLQTIVKKRRTFGNVENEPGPADTDDTLEENQTEEEEFIDTENYILNVETGLLEHVTSDEAPIRSASRASSKPSSTPSACRENISAQNSLNKAVKAFETCVASRTKPSKSSVQSFCDSLVEDLENTLLVAVLVPTRPSLCKLFVTSCLHVPGMISLVGPTVSAKLGRQ